MGSRRNRDRALRTRRHAARRAGFTLLEMMVALVAGALAIGSIYYVSAASSHHFHEQQRVAQAQMGLRMALEQIRRDISRAGFLGTPNSRREQTCFASAGQVQAVELLDNRDGDIVDPAGVNGVEADILRMTGNYITSDAYLATGLSGTGDTLFLQRNWQAFRRTFGAADLGEFDEEAFNDVFREGRFVHIETRQGKHFFSRVVGTIASQAAVRINPALPIGGHCVVGLADGATIAPLTRVEYRVVDPSTVSELSRLASGSEAIGVNGPVLMRQELEIGSATAIPNTQRVVAEYVAHFDVDFVLDDAVATGAAPALVLYEDADAEDELAPTANPHHVRSAIVNLWVRSSREDPRFVVTDPSLSTRLPAFDVDPTVPGAARVRRATAEVFMPNVAHRMIRP